MSVYEELKKAIQSMIQIPKIVVMGEVLEVQHETCTIKLADGLELPDVRLKQSIDNAQNYFIRSPKKGAQLTAMSLNGDLSELMILEASEYEFVTYVQDGLEFTMDSKTGKFTMKNEQANLFDLFSDLTSLLENIIVLTPQGPSSGLDPNTIASLQQFSIKFKQLLKQ